MVAFLATYEDITQLESCLADLGRIPEEGGPELDRSISLALEEDGDNIKAAFDSELSRITDFHRKKVCVYPPPSA